MWKVRGIILLVVLLWVAGALGYRAASSQKLRERLARQYGPGVVVEKVSYRETYGLADIRRGEAVFSTPAPREDPRNPRGFTSRKMSLPVETSGRWWPEEIRHGQPKIVAEENEPP